MTPGTLFPFRSLYYDALKVIQLDILMDNCMFDKL